MLATATSPLPNMIMLAGSGTGGAGGGLLVIRLGAPLSLKATKLLVLLAAPEEIWALKFHVPGATTMEPLESWSRTTNDCSCP